MDCNRAGILLIEIVTKPIMGAGERTPEVARAYVTALRELVAVLGVADACMDQGSMRVDSNVSLRPVGQAVRFEMQRQAQVLVDGCEIIQETRHYQEADGSTSTSHPKETAEDYRYFNDPDLLPVIVSGEWVEEMRDLVNADALDLIIETVEASTKKVTGAIVGAVMKATQGKADPGQVNKLIAKKLS